MSGMRLLIAVVVDAGVDVLAMWLLIVETDDDPAMRWSSALFKTVTEGQDG
jgi:hypothetical protein